MEIVKFDKQLKLIQLLLSSDTCTMLDLCQETGLTSRSIYRYFDLFTKAGIMVHRKENIYRIDANSSFFEKMNGFLFFTKEEALKIRAMLCEYALKDDSAIDLRRKMDRICKYNVLEEMSLEHDILQLAKVANTCIEGCLQMRVSEAQKGKRKRTVTGHIVEPYYFIAEKSTIRCYDVNTRRNINLRIEANLVFEALEQHWQFEPRHTPFVSDAFGYSSATAHSVTLQLDEHAAKLLMEEYPKSKRNMEQLEENRWQFYGQVCNMDVLVRFIMGTWSHVTILHSPELLRMVMKESEQQYRHFHKN